MEEDMSGGYPNRPFDPGPIKQRMYDAGKQRKDRLRRLEAQMKEGSRARIRLRVYFLAKDEQSERAARRREWFDTQIAKLFGKSKPHT